MFERLLLLMLPAPNEPTQAKLKTNVTNDEDDAMIGAVRFTVVTKSAIHTSVRTLTLLSLIVPCIVTAVVCSGRGNSAKKLV